MPNRPKRKKDRRNSLQYLLAISCCLIFLGNPADGMRCRIPYERVRENYCYFVADEKPLHTSFHNFCYQDKRTSRVCLDSDEKMRFLAEHLYEMGYPNGTQFWSAGHRWPGDNRFYWNYFGRARPLSYSNWAPDEPTPEMGRNCLILTLKGGELIMSSESCYVRAIDICEQSLNGTDSHSIMH
uniref:Uncharacterized protein LOC108040195 n=1 Tax=Drosophila rhopaloa TaxID=1041015 RepID=A0A6P4E916_DRORH